MAPLASIASRDAKVDPLLKSREIQGQFDPPRILINERDKCDSLPRRLDSLQRSLSFGEDANASGQFTGLRRSSKIAFDIESGRSPALAPNARESIYFEARTIRASLLPRHRKWTERNDGILWTLGAWIKGETTEDLADVDRRAG